jgi:hypothetical protein
MAVKPSTELGLGPKEFTEALYQNSSRLHQFFWNPWAALANAGQYG